MRAARCDQPGLAGAPDGPVDPTFDGRASDAYAPLLHSLLDGTSERTVWMYTPMALDLARALDPAVLVYDVMDDLAAFDSAPRGLVLRQRQALRDADVVFTGGRSLQRGVVEHRPSAWCFPSGVEREHYAVAVERRARRVAASGDARPVAGYVGVIDERLDLDLVAGLAERLPDWEIRMVGPVVKIDPSRLPHADNITYPGSKTYGELPQVMADFDVALMPFAMNEATRSISPTKTLEYFAAGLPVISTHVPDVVADYSPVVRLHDDGAGFAAACRSALDECPVARADGVKSILRAQHWDTIASRMAALIQSAGQAQQTG